MSDYQQAKKQDVKKSGNVPPAPKAKEKTDDKNAVLCPNCSASVPEGAIFCPECGAGLNPSFCPNCGAQTTSPDADICQGCGAWLLEGQCKFCYAQLTPGAEYCPNCGNPKDGIKCPNCGALSIFDFCTKCGKPLTEGAVAALELAKDDPDAKAMVEAVENSVKIEAELAELDALINSEPPADTAPGAFDSTPPEETIPPVETAPPPVRRERFSDRQMAAIGNTDKNIETAANRRAEEEKRIQEEARKRAAEEERKAKIREAKAREEARIKEEQERQERIREAMERKEALERQKEKELADAMAASARCRSKTFLSHQDARRFHNAMRPARVSGWLCNFSGTVHYDGPNGCADPARGGYWV